MGLGTATLSLYVQLHKLGAFEGIHRVVELGSQGVWVPARRTLDALFQEFGRSMPPDDEIAPYINSSGTGHAPSRHLHESLGFEYDCIDIDSNFGALPFDLNFDAVPPELKNKFCLTTNHGTTEHLLNQANAFKFIHDLTRKDGLMLHAVPFNFPNHGFFDYQPNLFEALARYNSYETLGIWLGLDSFLNTMIPWEPNLLKFLNLTSESSQILIVLQKKMFDTEFQIPIQSIYESGLPERAAGRYELVIDGEYFNGRRFTHMTQAPPNSAPSQTQPSSITANSAVTPNDFPARVLIRNLVRRAINRFI